MSDAREENEIRAIIATISEETEAFYNRDYDRWAGYWRHHPDVRRLGTLAGGQVDYKQGWKVESEGMIRIMRDHPEPNYTVQSKIRRENMTVRVSGDMAWVSFDQYAPRTDDVFVNIGLSHQIRVFEKHQGRWKIAFAGHGDTRAEYSSCPTIHIDRDRVVEWKNDAASTALPDHPILHVSNGQLRAHSREQDKILHATLARLADLTAMDIRRALPPNPEISTSIPLVFEDHRSDALHIIWVSLLDGQLLVSFDDQDTGNQRLNSAQAIYGLSKGQIRLAGLIVDGKDLRQAAEHLDISINTARTHLQRMFDKTRVRSQTALVRVLLSASAPDM